MKIKFDKTPFRKLTEEEKLEEKIRLISVTDMVLKDLERLRKKQNENRTQTL